MKDAKPKKGDLVRVDWLDADSEAGWQDDDPKTDDSVETMPSFGLMASYGVKFLTLSHCFSGDQWLGKHRIPIGMIHNIEVLDKGGKK